jgi:hypothetical protein
MRGRELLAARPDHVSLIEVATYWRSHLISCSLLCAPEGKAQPTIGKREALQKHLQALLQAAGRELLHNPDVDLVSLAAQLRRAGVVHGRGALEDFNLSYQALQDLTPLAQREQPLDMDHLKAQATLLYRDPRVAEDLLKDFMIVAHSWADLHPEIDNPNFQNKVRTLHTDLGKARTGPDRNPDFRLVIDAFARARIRPDREEFRPLAERLLALFPAPQGPHP